MSLNHILSTYLKSNLRQYIQFWLFSEIIITHHWILIILLNRIWNNSNISITPFIIPSQKSTFSSSFSLNIQNISMPFCSSISFSFNPKFIVFGLSKSKFISFNSNASFLIICCKFFTKLLIPLLPCETFYQWHFPRNGLKKYSFTKFKQSVKNNDFFMFFKQIFSIILNNGNQNHRLLEQREKEGHVQSSNPKDDWTMLNGREPHIQHSFDFKPTRISSTKILRHY